MSNGRYCVKTCLAEFGCIIFKDKFILHIIHLLVLITAIIFSTYNYIYATHSEIIGSHNKLKAMHIIYLTTFFAKIRFERDSNSILLNSQPRSPVALGS